MTFSDFLSLVNHNPDGGVLLEGRRAIPDDDARRAREIAASLASRFPTLRFRSGNAEGSDEAFASGIATVDPARLQVIAPYAGHRKRVHYAEAIYDSPESLSSTQEDEIAHKTSTASPKNQSLISKRHHKELIPAKRHLVSKTQFFSFRKGLLANGLSSTRPSTVHWSGTMHVRMAPRKTRYSPTYS
jgi:hypothetical protein